MFYIIVFFSLIVNGLYIYVYGSLFLIKVTLFMVVVPHLVVESSFCLICSGAKKPAYTSEVNTTITTPTSPLLTAYDISTNGVLCK